MKKNILILITFLVIVLSGCNKLKEEVIECDNAQLCVKNIGTDTILYCWGCNYYEDTLLPGGKACTNVGEVYVNSTRESTSTVTFDSDHGSFAVTVDDCYIEKEID